MLGTKFGTTVLGRVAPIPYVFREAGWTKIKILALLSQMSQILPQSPNNSSI
jgi:hypothetical protein